MNGVFYGFLVFFALVSLIGGINWLVTAINNWSDDEKTNDLLTNQLGMNEDLAHIIYIVVFVCTLALFLMVAFPQNMKNAFSTVAKIPRGIRSMM